MWESKLQQAAAQVVGVSQDVGREETRAEEQRQYGNSIVKNDTGAIDVYLTCLVGSARCQLAPPDTDADAEIRSHNQQVFVSLTS
jgi:hypothetical protein